MPSNGTARIVLRGGGSEQHFTQLGVPSQPHWRSNAVLVLTSADPVRYERRLRNGAVEVFAQSDGTTPGGRRVFLTDIIDARGQSVHFTYDSSLRLVALTDALGQVTTLAYDLPADPLKITSVTDPFGRVARLTYNAAGQLASLTDIGGLTSSFVYGTGDFLAAMTTPYGTTTFRHEPDPVGLSYFRFIEATDPLGGTEHLEFHASNAQIAATESAVPTGFSAANANLDLYLTFSWDKRAWLLAPGDLTSATMTKWLLGYGDLTNPSEPSTSVPHSVKKPLEHRVWYAYPGQADAAHVGTWTQPSVTARVLDDGTTQTSAATYNDHGMVTSRTDPLGRRTSWTYASNGIDLLEVRQTTGSLNDVLATYADYTTKHLPQRITDASGQTTTMTYTASGQPLTVTNANVSGTFDTDRGFTGHVTTSSSGPLLSLFRAYDDSQGRWLSEDPSNPAGRTTGDPEGSRHVRYRCRPVPVLVVVGRVGGAAGF